MWYSETLTNDVTHASEQMSSRFVCVKELLFSYYMHFHILSKKRHVDHPVLPLPILRILALYYFQTDLMTHALHSRRIVLLRKAVLKQACHCSFIIRRKFKIINQIPNCPVRLKFAGFRISLNKFHLIDSAKKTVLYGWQCSMFKTFESRVTMIYIID